MPSRLDPFRFGALLGLAALQGFLRALPQAAPSGTKPAEPPPVPPEPGPELAADPGPGALPPRDEVERVLRDMASASAGSKQRRDRRKASRRGG